MNKELKPCPFCGNEDIVVEKLYYKEDIFLNAYHFSVDCVCQKCRTLKNITVIGKNQEECCNKVKEEWNKRI